MTVLQSPSGSSFCRDSLPVEVDSSSLDHSSSPSNISNSGSSPQLSGMKRQAVDDSLFLPAFKLQEPENDTAYTFCKVCQVSCMSAFNYKQHIAGRKHKLKLEELKSGQEDHTKSCEGVNPGLSCDLCKIWCMNEDALKAHLKGQKHKRTLQREELTRKNHGANCVKLDAAMNSCLRCISMERNTRPSCKSTQG